MKSKLTLLMVALLSIYAFAATTWKATEETPVAAGSTLIDDELVTAKTVYETTLKTAAKEIAGEEFTHYIQVRVDAAPTADEPNGTNKEGSTPIILTAKKDLTLKIYYRRQSTSQNEDSGVYASNDGKDLKIVNQADLSQLDGTLTIVEETEDFKYAWVTKEYELAEGNTYTIFGRGTTINYYGMTYEGKEPPAPVVGEAIELNPASGDITSTFWVCLIYGVFINLQNYGIDQNYVQRYHAAKTDKDARFSALFGGYLFIPVSALFFLIGTALYSYYTANPDLLPTEIAQKPDYVFPYFIVNGLPVGLRGLLIASIFAAGMSTVSTSVTSAATIILTDYYKPFTKGKTDKHHVAVLRISSVIVGVLGIIVAIAMLSVESIIDAWWKLSSIFSGGMLGLFLLGCVSRRINRVGALIGCICGVLVIAWISLAGLWNLPGIHLHEYLAIVLGTCTIFLVGFLLTFLLKESTPKCP